MDSNFAAVDAYIAALEDASGMPAVVAEHFGLRECPDCGASGYATTIDGRSLGVCSTCGGSGAAPGSTEGAAVDGVSGGES
jgi:hypothetical protein